MAMLSLPRQAAEGAALEQLDAQIEEDSGLDEPALEQLRVKRRQKVKKIADANARLVVRNSHQIHSFQLLLVLFAPVVDMCTAFIRLCQCTESSLRSHHVSGFYLTQRSPTSETYVPRDIS